MPEGHTLHRLASSLTHAFAPDVVSVTSPQGRFAESAALLDGHVLAGASSYGKHLFVDFDVDQLIHVHLGLYGRFDVHAREGQVPDAIGQVRLRLVGPRAYADLRGATACELVTPEQRHLLLARLGPDPLRTDADPDRAWQWIRTSRAPIAGLLMDQAVVAGIGNVYRAELLYRHRVDPFRAGRTLRSSTWSAMWEDLVALMADGVRVGRIDTVRPGHLTDDEVAQTGDRRGYSYVYRRAGEPCRVCSGRVRTKVLQTRNLYWCPRCQPRFRSRAKG